MDKNSWLTYLATGKVLRPPRKPTEKEYDTIIFENSFNSILELKEAIERLKINGRLLLLVPSQSSPNKFPEEAGRVWEKERLKETIECFLKEHPEIKQKLFFECYPEINNGYIYFYIAFKKVLSAYWS